MKTHMRTLGIDDAPFDFSDEDVLVVGSLVRAPNYLEGVLSTTVEVDGTDATERIIEMVINSRFSEQTKMIFTDGAALGGFNLIDLEKLWEETGIPCVSVSRDKPDFDTIEKAMRAHFEDWEEKFQLIRSGDIIEVETEHKPIYIQVEGEAVQEVLRLLKLFTVRGRLPEPIRISHIIASGIIRGESKGKP